jgi:chromosome segregation ATPase
MEPTTMWIILALALAAIVALVVLLITKGSELNQARGQSTDLDRQLNELRTELRSFKDEQSKLRESVNEYKDKLHHTKKKSHSMHEEFETIRRGWDGDKEALQAREEELRALHRELETVREEARELRAKAEAAPKVVTRTEPSAPRAAEKAHDKPAPETTARMAQLEKDFETMRHDFNKALAERSELRRTVQSLEKRIEDYRRSDLIARSKLEVAEDKLADMGKRYYNAVSELALAKGQVAPLPPKHEREQTPVRDSQEPTPAGTPAPGDVEPATPV